MITEIGVFPELEESRSTITKSSMTPENTSTALAKMAGPSSGSRTRRIVWNWLAPRSAAASSYCLPSVTSRAWPMMTGQLTFQVTSPRTYASVPRCTEVKSTVNTKNLATPKISSGTTKDRIITKLNVDGTGPRHRLMPSANATPSGTAMSVVKTDSRTVWITAACSWGLCSTEFTGSVKYQRQEKPCQALCDLPLLNENSTASAIGTSDQIRYSQVKPSRNQGCPHGLRRGSSRLPMVRGRTAALLAAAGTLVAVTSPPGTSGWSPPRNRSSARAARAAAAWTAPRPAPPARACPAGPR